MLKLVLRLFGLTGFQFRFNCFLFFFFKLGISCLLGFLSFLIVWLFYVDRSLIPGDIITFLTKPQLELFI